MYRCVREMTAKEMIENSDIANKDELLSKMKEADYRTEQRIANYDKTISEQANVIVSYRTVLKDMIYSGWLNN